jgi:hypothetical protein
VEKSPGGAHRRRDQPPVVGPVQIPSTSGSSSLLAWGGCRVNSSPVTRSSTRIETPLDVREGQNGGESPGTATEIRLTRASGLLELWIGAATSSGTTISSSAMLMTTKQPRSPGPASGPRRENSRTPSSLAETAAASGRTPGRRRGQVASERPFNTGQLMPTNDRRSDAFQVRTTALP